MSAPGELKVQTDNLDIPVHGWAILQYEDTELQ